MTEADQVGLPALAKIFEVSERDIHLLAKSGMPKNGRGEYPLLACIQWYIKHLRTRAEGRGTGKAAEGLVREKSRKERALADIHEAELAERRGELFNQQYLEAQMNRMGSAIAGEIRNQPAAVLRTLIDAKVIKPRMERRARRLLEDQLEELLTALQTAGDDLDEDDDEGSSNARDRKGKLVA